jgi:hypothetical protein
MAKIEDTHVLTTMNGGVISKKPKSRRATIIADLNLK